MTSEFERALMKRRLLVSPRPDVLVHNTNPSNNDYYSNTYSNNKSDDLAKLAFNETSNNNNSNSNSNSNNNINNNNSYDHLVDHLPPQLMNGTWSLFQSPEGWPYYYNNITGQSIWAETLLQQQRHLFEEQFRASGNEGWQTYPNNNIANKNKIIQNNNKNNRGPQKITRHDSSSDDDDSDDSDDSDSESDDDDSDSDDDDSSDSDNEKSTDPENFRVNNNNNSNNKGSIRKYKKKHRNSNHGIIDSAFITAWSYLQPVVIPINNTVTSIMKRFEKRKGKIVDESSIKENDVEANESSNNDNEEEDDDDDEILNALRSPEKVNNNDPNNNNSNNDTQVSNWVSIPALLEKCAPATQLISNTFNNYLPSERRADLSNRLYDFAWFTQGRVADFGVLALQAAGTGLGVVSETIWTRLDPLLQSIIDNLDLGGNNDDDAENANTNDRNTVQETPRESLEP